MKAGKVALGMNRIIEWFRRLFKRVGSQPPGFGASTQFHAELGVKLIKAKKP